MKIFRHKKDKKKILQHDCQLPNRHKNLLVQFIDSGYFVNLRRKIRSYVLCSENNPRSKMFLKSSATIYSEIQNHLQLYYYMIHPFSMMRVMWEMFMMVVFLILLVYIPLDVCFTIKATLYDRLPRIFLDFVCLVDIAMSFMTGYQDDSTKKIIMAPKVVAVRYLKTWFFVDLISSINTDIFIIIFNLKEHGMWLKLPAYLKFFHITTLIKYMGRFREWKETSLYRFKMMKMFMLFIILVIWTSCTLYVIALYMEEYWIMKITANGLTLLHIWQRLRTCMVRVVMNFFLISHGFDSSESLPVFIFILSFFLHSKLLSTNV